MSMLAAARTYLSRGWPVLPLRPGGKEPYGSLLPLSAAGVRSWSQLVCEGVDEEDVARWISEAPDLNLGIVTGEAANCLVVADFDHWPEPALYQVLQQLETPIVVTGRGLHVYLQADRHVRTHQARSRSLEFELKASGAYVVAPPSVHPSGVHYSWEVSLANQLASVDLFELALDNQGTDAHGPRGLGKHAISERTVPSSAPTYPGLGPSGLGRSGLGQPGASEVSGEQRPELVRDLLAEAQAAALLAARPQDASSRRDWFRAIARNEFLARMQTAVLGVPDLPLGRAFLCLLHPEETPSAALYRGDNGEVVYHDFHCTGEVTEYLTLPELRASLACGRPTKLPRTQLSVWRIRLLVEAGLLTPRSIELRPLPAEASAHVRRVYEGVELFFRCRWLLEPGAEAPFTRRFAVGWCGVTEQQAQDAIRRLKSLGILVKVGEQASGFPRPTDLFLPGTLVRNRELSLPVLAGELG